MGLVSLLYHSRRSSGDCCLLRVSVVTEDGRMSGYVWCLCCTEPQQKNTRFGNRCPQLCIVNFCNYSFLHSCDSQTQQHQQKKQKQPPTSSNSNNYTNKKPKQQKDRNPNYSSEKKSIVLVLEPIHDTHTQTTLRNTNTRQPNRYVVSVQPIRTQTRTRDRYEHEHTKYKGLFLHTTTTAKPFVITPSQQPLNPSFLVFAHTHTRTRTRVVEYETGVC